MLCAIRNAVFAPLRLCPRQLIAAIFAITSRHFVFATFFFLALTAFSAQPASHLTALPVASKFATNCLSPPEGLVLWLPGEGDPNELIANRRAAAFGGVSYAEGIVGKAFSFDGVDDWVDVWKGFDLEVFTFEMWIKEGDKQIPYADILDTLHQTAVGIVLQLTPGTQHDYYVTVGDTSVSGVQLKPGVWQHFAFSRNSEGIIDVFLDGSLVGSRPGGPLEYSGLEFLRLGCWGYGGRHWKGQIDEFDIYERALTVEEIQALHAAGPLGKCRPTPKSGFDDRSAPVLPPLGQSPNPGSLGMPGPDFHIRQWSTATGLPSSRVQALLQTSDGYLWAGLLNSVVRLSPKSLEVIDLSGACTALAQDRSGTIWIGTRNGLFRCEQGRISAVPLPDSTAFRDRTVTTVALRAAGGIWGADANGLFSVADERFVRYGHFPAAQHLLDDGKGSVWAISQSRAFRLHPETGKIEPVHPKGKETPAFAQCLLPTGVVLFGSDESSVFRQDDRFILQDEPMNGWIRAFAFDRNGTIWAGGHLGLWQLAETNLYRVSNLPIKGVTALYPNAEGGLWIGTENDGLYLVSPKPIHTFTRADGLPGDTVTSVCSSRDGSIWIATTAGLARLAGTEIQPVINSDAAKFIPACLVEDSTGTVWLGGSQAGNGKAIAPLNALGNPDIFSGSPYIINDVSSLAPGPDGSLWIAAGDGHRGAGLYLLTNGIIEQAPFLYNGVPVEPRHLFVDDRSNLWHSTTWLIREGPSGHSNITGGFGAGTVAARWQDPEGALWLASEKQGVIRLKNSNTVPIDKAHGFTSDLILDLLPDNHGRLWFNSHQGIFWARKSDLDEFADGRKTSVTCVRYGIDDGFISAEGNGGTTPNSAKAADGKLYFPTIAGLAVVDPALTLHDAEPAPVHIEKLTADGTTLYSNVPTLQTHNPPPPAIPVRIQAGHADTLTFHFACNSFLHPELIRYRYRLAGKQRNWIDAGGQNLAQFQNLPPGDYTFELTASNSRGVWIPAATTFAFTIQPFFHQTWTFRAAVALLFLGIIAAFYSYRASVQRRILALETDAARAHERERIARDLHDDVGANLTRIAMLTDAVRSHGDLNGATPQIERISAISREVLNNMSELVWAANPRYDDLQNFAAYLREYAAQLFSPTQIRFTFESNLANGKRPLPSQLRRNLFLAIKEALNNILKHAAAQNVILRLTQTQSTLNIQITDDGHGLPENRTSPFGNGLHNIRHRVETSGGQIQFTPANPGLRITATIPLPAQAPSP